MKIDLNKDFEEQYKNELWKGFTARELGYGVVALLVAGGIAFFCVESNRPCNQSFYLCRNPIHGSDYLSSNGEAPGTYLD